jgi:hypothetical protein
MSMQINIEEFKKFIEYTAEINSSKLEDIELYDENGKIELESDIVSEWKFFGLSNTEFVKSVIKMKEK